jgi:hypothetical protein
MYLVFVAAWVILRETEIRDYYSDHSEINDDDYQDDIKASAEDRKQGFDVDDEFFRDVHIFYILFSPLLILVTRLEGDDVCLTDACPLIFQTFQTYKDMRINLPIFSQTGAWSTSLNILVRNLWYQTLGGQWGPLICASYALTACGWASLQEGSLSLSFIFSLHVLL